MCMSVCAWCLQRLEDVRSLNYSYRRLWATTWMPETKPRFSTRAASNHWAISPGPGHFFTFFFNVYGYFVYMYIYTNHVHAWWPRRPEDDIGSPSYKQLCTIIKVLWLRSRSSGKATNVLTHQSLNDIFILLSFTSSSNRQHHRSR